MDTSKLRKRMPVATLFDLKIVAPAISQAFVKLNPGTLIKNPVIFVLEVVTVLTTVLFVRDMIQHHAGLGFTFQIIVWLWFTVLFANFAEAVAEGRGRAQADTLRKTRTETRAKRILMPDNYEVYEGVSAEDLRAGDLVVCEAGDIIPGDGDVIEGIASVNEAAITGESAPVIRESGGDRSSVTGGTRVLSDWIVVRIATNPRVFEHPLSLDQALSRVQSWLDQPCTRVVHATDRHWVVFRQMLEGGQAVANLVTDAHLAALASEHGCVLMSTDADFSRFPGLTWKNPLNSVS